MLYKIEYGTTHKEKMVKSELVDQDEQRNIDASGTYDQLIE
jgi:hypothetical protein